MIEAICNNMDIKFIGSGASAKAILYYITDYITKSQLKTHVVFAMLELAVKKLDCFRNELSAQQVASYLLNCEDHFTSHSYRNFYWTSFENFINKEDPSPECYPSKVSANPPEDPNKESQLTTEPDESELLFLNDLFDGEDTGGPYFVHDKAQLVQRDYRDSDGSLIAPHELYNKLTEGTLIFVTVLLATYIITDQKAENGAPRPDKKIYHILVDQLKILDHGDGEPWNPPVPAMPERRYCSPATPKRARDEAADAAFNNFGSRASPSPAKKSKCSARNN
ncbi:hypothetical protein B0H17DRAFT_1127126 [Mycena rosella]|uniref:Uncharacterized protein n=1 Tax=Mycena rosella TaxID=1033263 RepID=A0AAD7M704_MYCRO|nr:hypothetical protein B0H17DRAFT_1127126 [Mycena rosella]